MSISADSLLGEKKITGYIQNVDEIGESHQFSEILEIFEGGLQVQSYRRKAYE